MPELAEVDYYRRQWNPGLGRKITALALHADKRIFRGADPKAFQNLAGKKLQSSASAGKQMLFRFSGNYRLGLHLGMTGKLSVSALPFEPGRHDHLVLFQARQALIFTDARQFGRIQFHHGKEAPEWWSSIAPAVTSSHFTLNSMAAFLAKHPRLPIKGALLLQKGFPGIGNWMADEILWRAGIDPRRSCARLKAGELKQLWRESRFVARQALAKIGPAFEDPPAGWFFHQRWKPGGICPRHKIKLKRETVAGRTTAWCPRCQSPAGRTSP
jgi:formamidopyrimidine-DNA glycosylase